MGIGFRWETNLSKCQFTTTVMLLWETKLGNELSGGRLNDIIDEHAETFYIHVFSFVFLITFSHCSSTFTVTPKHLSLHLQKVESESSDDDLSSILYLK